MALPIKDLGPASVVWDPDGDNIELNPTFGGVVFTDEVKYKTIGEDGYGETPVDATFIGRECKLVVPMTRSSLAQLSNVIPSSAKTGSTLEVASSVGTQMFADAKEVIVKPLVDNVSSVVTSEWLHIRRAYPISKAEFKYDVSNQRICEVTFLCFPDDSTGHVGDMWQIGPDV